jgi:hypothetical protein
MQPLRRKVLVLFIKVAAIFQLFPCLKQDIRPPQGHILHNAQKREYLTFASQNVFVHFFNPPELSLQKTWSYQQKCFTKNVWYGII